MENEFTIIFIILIIGIEENPIILMYQIRIFLIKLIQMHRVI